jgi:hypothetical protein
MKRILIGTSCTLFALIGLLFIFVLYPNNLFARRVVHKAFSIYSNQEINDNFKQVLDNAIDIAKASELFDSNYQYDIFLTDGSFYKDVIFKLMGPSLARSIDNNILLNIKADFEQNLLIGPKNKRDLTLTIAHEMVHCLQMKKYGLLKFNPIHHPPLWKQEGYPEYIVNRNDTANFVETVKMLRNYEVQKATWVELQPGHFDPIIYFKGRVMIKYLMDIKGMSYEQLLHDDVKEEVVDHEITEWYKAQLK